MGRLRSFVGVLVVGILVWAAGPLAANAQDPAAQARARQLYGEAQALFDAGQYAPAEAKFREAYAAVPNPVVLRAIALAQERQGNLAGAAATLQQYVQAAPDASDRAESERKIAELTARSSTTVTVETTPPGAQVFVDGQSVNAVTPTDIRVPAGTHTIEVRLDGHQTRSQEITAQAGQGMRLAFPLQPGQSGPAAGSGTGSADPSVGVWVTAGIAAATLVSGTVFGFLALSEQSNFEAAPSHEIADRGELFALIADISFGVAAAAAITAVVLYIVERGSGGGETQTATSGLRLDVAPLVYSSEAGANGGGLSAQLRF